MYAEIGEIVYTGLVLFVAYMVRGISGFGSGLIAIPLLTLFHPITLVVPLVVVLDFLGSAAQGVRNRAAIQWTDILPLLPFTLVGVLAALYLFNSVDVELITKAMAVFIIIFALYQLLPLPDIRGGKFWAAPVGLLGGLVGTLFGTGGPFYMIYMNIRGLNKEQTRASFATYFFMDGSVRIVGFLVVGLIGITQIKVLLTWLPITVLGLFIGGRIHTGISAKTFKYFISLLLVLGGYRLLTR